MKNSLFILGAILLSSCGVVDFVQSDSVSTNPSDYNQVLAEDEEIYVQFDFSPDHASAQAAFEVQDSSGRINGTFSWNKSIMFFHPKQSFSVSHRYLLKYVGQVLDTKGKEREYNIYIPFYYMNRSEPSPAVTMVPSPGSVIQKNDKVVFSFSKAMDPDTLLRSFSITPEKACKKIWSSSCKELTIIPDKPWKEYTAYSFTFSQEMSTSSGIQLPEKVSWVLYCTSGAAVPVVNSADTALNDGLEYPVLQRGLDRIKEKDVIQVSFSVPMEREKTENAFSVVPDLHGYTYWKSDSALLFVPEDNWKCDTEYTVSVSADAQSREGLKMQENYEIRFTPDIARQNLVRLDGKETDGFPMTSFDYTQETEIEADTVYTFGFVFSQSLGTASEKEEIFSHIVLIPLFPPGLPTPKVLSQFWIGDDALYVTYTGFIPGGSRYSLEASGRKMTVRTK